MAFQEVSTAQSNQHGIVLEDRKSMTLTGVKEVADFSEQKIVVQTELGKLTITGSSLHIGKFDTKAGELRVAGTIDSLVYSNENKSIGNFLERFKDSFRTFSESVPHKP
ncbi:MAG: sporulation protein YabP [Clostridia bacterium]|nr:sporulation protein YabP [Clostridia bacterium]